MDGFETDYSCRSVVLVHNTCLSSRVRWFLEVVVDLMFLLILIAWPPKLTYVFGAAFIKTFVFEGARIS